MKQTNKLLLALLSATWLNANAAADPQLVNYDVDGNNITTTGEQAYKLTSASDLIWFRNYVNNGGSNANAFLADDITLNDNLSEMINIDSDGKVTAKDASNKPTEWICIKDYQGTFDGANHTISGVFLNNNTTDDFVGLFASNKGTIKNVKIADSFFYSSTKLGGFCGKNVEGGIIDNCSFLVSVISCSGNYAGAVCCTNYGTISNCYNTGAITSMGNYIGGICANNFGTIDNCYNTHCVDGIEYVGGVCGYNEQNATIVNCYNTNTGYVDANKNVGGVCGLNYLYGKITNCYNTGMICYDDVDENEERIGGICGSNFGTINICYNNGIITGDKYVSGVCGYNESGHITNCYNTGEIESNGDFIGGVCGYTSSGYIINSYNAGKINDKYVSGVCGVNEGVITSCYYLASEDDGNGGRTAEQFADGTTVVDELHNYDSGKDEAAKIGSDIWGQYIGIDETPTFRGNVKFEPTKITKTNCASFNLNENYDGYYAISDADDLYWFAKHVNSSRINTNVNAVLTSNIVVNKDLLSSLVFGYGGYISNEDAFKTWNPIGNSDIIFNGTFDGNGHTISGLFFNDISQTFVGLFGQIECATIKNIGVIDSYFNAYSLVGGICGGSKGTIENCYNTSSVNINSGTIIGGVCGYNYGTITNCYNTGKVNGNEYDGGVCGENVYSITNCYYLASTDDGNGGKTADQFADGTVAKLLQDGDKIWGQTIGKDPSPIFSGKIVEASSTAIKAIEAGSNKTIKTIKDGQIVIIRDGVMYDMQGRKL